MSEPLSNHEIEDVVSSIRRLVSTEPRQKTRDLGHDRLMLTPALRIVPEPVMPAEPVATVTSEPLVLAEIVADETASVEAVSDQASVAEAGVADTSVAETSVAETSVAVVAEAYVAETSVADVAEAYVTDAGVAETNAANLDSDPVPDDVAASSADSPGATLHLIDAEWEDEIWEEPEPTLAEIAEGVEDAELVAEAAPPEVVSDDEDLAVDDVAVQFHAHRRAAAAAVTADDAEPAAADATADLQAGDGAVPPETTGSVVVGAEAAGTGGEVEAGYAMLDEDVLNEIVRDLIREELQGALGERITRNVRKLVRAEINRALASRAYE